jgi:peptidoglycan/LPS O-acetylase OafA/YrhL
LTFAPPPDHKSTYRPDIDGLRAIAVLSVVLYHFRCVGFSGGYVGVDIFFVISGYLIGGIIIGDSSRGVFSYVRFYTRRIKRLFAAYFIVGMATLAAGWWLLMPADYRAYAKTLIASTAFLSNVVFYHDAGYFDASSSSKPLLHTWSLGVEEQFYIFFPILIRIALRFGGKAATLRTILAVAVASLVASQYLLVRDPPASFFLLIPRAWEMMLGAAASQILADDRRLPAAAGRVLTWVALAAIAATIGLFNDRTPFPGLSALPCCLATAWLLWYGARQPGDAVERTLGKWLPVAVGRISYSMYLWHWPVYVFLLYYLAGSFPWEARLAAFALTCILSVASWRYVEQPVRYTKRGPKVVFGGFVAGSLVLAALGFLVWRTDGVPNRLPPSLQAIAYAAGDFMKPRDQCREQHESGFCQLGIEGAPHFLVWGDSHARANFDGLNLAAKEQGVAGALFWQGGCMPAFDIRKTETASGPEADALCTLHNAEVRRYLGEHGTIKKVLLIGRWSYYTEGEGIGEDRQNRIRVERITPAATASAGDPSSSRVSSDEASIVTSALSDSVRWLHDNGFEVYVMEQPPEIPEFIGRRLFQTVRGNHASVEQAIADFGSVAREAVDRRQMAANEALQLLAARGEATLLPTHDLFCGRESCTAWGGSAPAYFDNNHLTNQTSQRIHGIFVPAMR